MGDGAAAPSGSPGTSHGAGALPACSKPAAGLTAGLCAAGGLAHLAVLVTAVTVAGPRGIDGINGINRIGGVHGWAFAAMAVTCLFCAAHLLWARSAHALRMTVALAALMLLVHVGYLLAVTPGFGATETAHAHRNVENAGEAPVGMAAAEYPEDPEYAAHPARTAHGLTSPGTAVPMLAELAVLAVAVPVLRRSRLSRRSEADTTDATSTTGTTD